MSKLLCLETATEVCSVALVENGQLLALEESGGSYSHAEKLAGFIEKVLATAAVEYADLAAVAVSKGPGSYTGLRIGVSTAKGLCFALGIPLIAIDTLKSMANGQVQKAEDKHAYFCPMIDARRMEVYAAIYDAELKEIRNVAADIVDEDTYAAHLQDQQIYFFGNGAEKCRSILEKFEHARFINDGLPSAAYMAKLAQEKWEKADFEDVAYFEPYYLKDFVATQAKPLS